MRSDNQESFEDLFAFYALGTLTKEERQQVDAYVQQNPGTRAVLQEMVEAASALAHDPQVLTPRATALARLIDRIRQASSERQSAQSQKFKEHRFLEWLGRNRTRKALALLIVLIATLSGTWLVERDAQIRDLRAELAHLERTLAEQDEIVGRIAAPGVERVEVLSTVGGSPAAGRLYADPSATTAVLVVWGLIPLPPEEGYQVWLIADETPVSAGTLTIRDEQSSGHLLELPKPLQAYDAIGISVEPFGGSELPTGAVVLFATLAD